MKEGLNGTKCLKEIMNKKTARKRKAKIKNNKKCAEILKDETATSDNMEKDCKSDGTVKNDHVNEKDAVGII